MNGMEVILPGGLREGARLHRSARFHPISGHLERALAEPDIGISRPEMVTELLLLVIDSIGEMPADRQCIEGLCVADRQYLMMQLSILLGGDTVWLRAVCSDCGSPFDINVRRSELPVRGAAEGFPFISVDTSVGKVEMRVPNGGDQAAIVKASDAVSQLFRRCMISIDGKEPGDDALHLLVDDELAGIEQVLEDLSPAVCETLLGQCPECGKSQQIGIDPYGLDMFCNDDFDEEVHMLALHYHWSEAEILTLPRERRRRYLNMVERDAGRYVQGEQ